MATTTMSRPASAGELLRCRCEGLVTAEMERLVQRVPALRSWHLGVVETALGRVVDDLVLARARSVRGDHLAELFDLADVR